MMLIPKDPKSSNPSVLKNRKTFVSSSAMTPVIAKAY